jgi:hypothetical protein
MGTPIRALLAITFAAVAVSAALAGPAAGANPLAVPPSTPAPPPPTTDRPPSPPTNFTVSGVTPTSVTLSWTASTPGSSPVDSYAVNHTQAFNDIHWSQQVGNVTTVTITSNIRPINQYTFWVLARGTDGRISTSPPAVTAMTPAGTTGDTAPPTAPTDLRLTGTTSAGSALAWNPSADDTGVTGYNVYFFDGWYSSTLVGTTTATAFVAPPGSSGTGLSAYYVRAKDAAGNLSIASNTVRPGTTPTPTTPLPVRTCRVAYDITSEWPGGFVAELTITNTAPTAVDGWTLTFPTGGDQRLTSAWNATLTQTATDVTLTAARWNTRIPPGAGVTVGLLGRWTTSNAPPAAFTLNGHPCDRT